MLSKKVRTKVDLCAAHKGTHKAAHKGSAQAWRTKPHKPCARGLHKNPIRIKTYTTLMKSAEALSLRACRSGANPPIKSTNPPLNPRGEEFMPPPYPPPRLRLAALLAAAPGEVSPRPLQNRSENPTYFWIDF